MGVQHSGYCLNSQCNLFLSINEQGLSLQQKIVKYNKLGAKLNDEIARLTKQQNDLKGSLSQGQKKKAQLQKDIDQLHKDIQLRTNSIRSLSTQYKGKQSQIQQLKRQMSTIKANTLSNQQQHKRQLNLRRKQIQDINRLLQQHGNQLRNKQAIKQQLQVEIGLLKAKSQKIEREIMERKGDLIMWQNQAKEWQKRTIDMESQLSKSTKEVAQKDKQLKRLKNLLEELKKQIREQTQNQQTGYRPQIHTEEQLF